MVIQNKITFVFVFLLIMTLFTNSCIASNNMENEQLYSIDKLKAFFEKDDKLSFEESCLSFPDCSLRTIQDDEAIYITAYSVYSVAEGGRYYVFWYNENETNSLIKLQSYYIKHLTSADRLATINHQSTIDDVLQIDPSACVVMYSTYSASYSLANDGNVYVVIYHKEADHVNYVSSIGVCNSNECALCYILREDYP